MKLTIDTDILEKSGLDKATFGYLLSSYFGKPDKELLDHFHKNGLLLLTTTGYVLTKEGSQYVTDLFLDMDNTTNSANNDITALAKALKEIYPKGKKPGTNYYWTDGVPLIERRLKIFFKKYGNYSSEDIINATKKYVDDNINSTYMKLLKYFIFKEVIGASNDVESQSDLLTYLENKNETSIPSDWDIELK